MLETRFVHNAFTGTFKTRNQNYCRRIGYSAALVLNSEDSFVVDLEIVEHAPSVVSRKAVAEMNEIPN